MSTASLRSYFPVFDQPQNQHWIYLDSAATSQKLKTVIDISQDYYLNNAVNVHRSSHQVAAKVTADFEQARQKVQRFIGAKQVSEIVWTKGATESINLVAHGLAATHFKPNDQIVISALEHHANIVPWQQLAKRLNLQLKIMPVDEQGVLILEQALDLINPNTALVAMGHVSNALGNINPIEPIIKKAKQVGALSLIDGTQAVNHLPVNVQHLDCDFYVFSGHKIFGPTGIGVLYAKYYLLEQMPPYQLGGEMIESVSFTDTQFQPPPLKFEAGTPNIAGVLGLSAAIDFLATHKARLQQVENNLYQQLLAQLSAMPNIKLWGDNHNSICVVSFTVNEINPYDLAVLLDKHNIALRVGHHCAMPLMQSLGIEGTIRVSLGPYNTEKEIQTFISALKHSIAYLTAPQTSQQHNVEQGQDKSVGSPLATALQQAKGWDQSYRQLMLAGKSLPRLEAHLKTPASEVSGCESQVWIDVKVVNNQLQLVGDSPSKIVRGLLAVVFEALSNQAPAQVLEFDLHDYLATLGLNKHLSPSRGNGLSAVLTKIRQHCQSHCDRL